MPRMLSHDEFSKWLVKCRKYDPRMAVKIMNIEIQKITTNNQFLSKNEKLIMLIVAACLMAPMAMADTNKQLQKALNKEKKRK